MKLKIVLLLTSTLAACATSPPALPRTSALCGEISLIEFHVPREALTGSTRDWWPDVEGNVYDTPETVRRIIIHNERLRALCAS